MSIIRQWMDKWRSGRDRNRIYNRAWGRWFVVYPDGKQSELMCWDVANDYAKMFGGEVRHVLELQLATQPEEDKNNV